MRAVISAGILLLGTGGIATAQLARYEPAVDTIRYQSLNSYFMYFIRGADTLGEPVSTTTRESRFFRKAGAGLEVWVRLEGDGFSAEETYAITPAGRVTAVGGRPVAEVPNARVDILPRLPAPTRALNAGVQWTDTAVVRGSQSYGSTHYEVRRAYRVTRSVDTLGTRLALIVADGQMKLRQGGWQDSAQGQVWWQEVSGPVADTVWFDARAGNVRQSVAVMNLSGNGGFGPIGGGVTMPSGLRSSVRLTRQE